MKKILIYITTLILLIQSSICVSAFYIGGLENFEKVQQYTDDVFVDIEKKDWYYENVASVYEYSLMNGKGNNNFDPSGNLTIAEVIAVSTRIHCNYYSGYVPEFQIEDGDMWYNPYISYGIENEILKIEYPNYSISATRAEFAKILAASVDPIDLEEINIVDDGAIPDVDVNSDYANAVYLLYRAGVLSGSDSNGTFNPDSTITRAEAAAIITRIIDPSLRKSIELVGEY